MKKIIFGTLAVLPLLCTSNAVVAGSANDAVFDERKRFVTDHRGNCVRTKWMGDEDVCAPPPPPAPPVVKAPPPPPPPAMPKNLFSKEQRTVYFGFDSSELTYDARSKIETLASLINASDKISDVSVVGFTDQMGSSDYNMKLSEERVKAVRNYLAPRLRIAISPSETQFRAAGKSDPTTNCQQISNRTERIDCMKAERRVEIKLNREYTDG